MKSRAAFLIRILVAASVAVCLAAPARAQRGGGGAQSGGHSSGGGAHFSGGHFGGGHAGPSGGGRAVSPGGMRGGSFAPLAGVGAGRSAGPRAGNSSAPGPMIHTRSYVATGSGAANVARVSSLPAMSGGSTQAGRMARAEMIRPASPRPAIFVSNESRPAPAPRPLDGVASSRTVSQAEISRRHFVSTENFSGRMPARRTSLVANLAPRPAAVGSVPFAMMRPEPEPFFFGHRRFVHSGVLFIGFGFGIGHRHRFGFFGGFPFGSPGNCFFNGFTTVCFSQFQPGFLCPFPFVQPFGFSPFFSPLGFNNAGSLGFVDNSAPAPISDEPAAASENFGNNVFQAPPEPPSGDAGEARPEGPTTFLVLSDGTTYGVTDYWLEAGRLHYVTNYGGENSIALDRLDFQRTVDENYKRGVTFTLRPAQ